MHIHHAYIMTYHNLKMSTLLPVHAHISVKTQIYENSCTLESKVAYLSILNKNPENKIRLFGFSVRDK
jgi:hypothetical protein